MPPRLHIQFAAGELEPELVGRSGPGDRPEWTARRDLARYYSAVAAELARIRLSEREALILVAAQTGTWTRDASDARMLWANVEDYLTGEQQDRVDAAARAITASADAQDTHDAAEAVADRVLGRHGAGDAAAATLAAPERAVLVAKLRALSPAAALAVIDACERYWTLVATTDAADREVTTLLHAVGLTHASR